MTPTRDFPGFSHVSEFGDPLSNRPLRGDFPRECVRQSLALARGEIRPDQPIVVRYQMGGASPSDFVWTNAICPVIVHARVIEILLSHRFTGWGTYPVEVRGKRDELFSDYHGLALTGRCGTVQCRADSLFQKQFPARAAPYYRGLYFDAGMWDGSDMFTPIRVDQRTTTAHRFVLEPVATAFRKAKIRNLRIHCAMEYEMDASFMSPADVIGTTTE